MPDRIPTRVPARPARPRTSRRTWIAAWAALCAGGVAATAALNASSTPDPRPEKTVSAECAQRISDLDASLAKAKADAAAGGGRQETVVAVGGLRSSDAEDCDDEVTDHLKAAR